MRRVGLSVLAASFLLIAGNIPLRSNPMDESRVETLKRLDRMTDAEQEALLNEIEQDRIDIKNMLLNHLDSENEQVRFCSAYMLGVYRYSEAVDDLAKVITMAGEDAQRRYGQPRWERPAVEALVSIGKPAVPAMLRHLETSDDEHIRGLSARVIYYVEGPDLAKIVVTNAIAKQTDPVKKERLEASLGLVRGGVYQKPQ